MNSVCLLQNHDSKIKDNREESALLCYRMTITTTCFSISIIIMITDKNKLGILCNLISYDYSLYKMKLLAYQGYKKLKIIKYFLTSASVFLLKKVLKASANG